jgi:hypothetical protein
MARVGISAWANTVPMRHLISSQYMRHARTSIRSRSGTGISMGIHIRLHLCKDSNYTEEYHTITTNLVLNILRKLYDGRFVDLQDGERVRRFNYDTVSMVRVVLVS